MAKTKTKPTEVSVESFLNRVDNADRRADAITMLELMKEITSEPAKMWGPSIVGFGTYHYVYESGHEGDICLAGFSPRKNALVVYFNGGFEERFAKELKTLGKAKTSKGCLYIKKLSDVDLSVLRQMIQANIAHHVGLAIKQGNTKTRK